jgi:acetyltransferase
VKEDTLNSLMKPKSLAIIGASSKPGKIGYTVIKNLIDSGYEGKVYPINPEADEILGFKVYKTISEVPGPVDAAPSPPRSSCPQLKNVVIKASRR